MCCFYLEVRDNSMECFGAESVAKQMLEEIGEATDGGDTYNEGNCRDTLPPGSVGELQMMLVLNRAKEELSDNPQDVDGCDHDRTASDDGEDEA